MVRIRGTLQDPCRRELLTTTHMSQQLIHQSEQANTNEVTLPSNFMEARVSMSCPSSPLQRQRGGAAAKGQGDGTGLQECCGSGRALQSGPAAEPRELQGSDPGAGGAASKRRPDAGACALPTGCFCDSACCDLGIRGLLLCSWRVHV